MPSSIVTSNDAHLFFFFFQAEDGIRDDLVTGVQTCALPISIAPTPRKPADGGRRSRSPGRRSRASRTRSRWSASRTRTAIGRARASSSPTTPTRSSSGSRRTSSSASTSSCSTRRAPIRHASWSSSRAMCCPGSAPPIRRGWIRMAATTETAAAISPHDFLRIDALLGDEERMIRDTVRSYVREQLLPQVPEWFEAGILPRETARGLGSLGLLGMHLEGYGCAGASAVAYGLACLELEAGDSGLRSLVSVQGSLSMFAIWRYGSEEQKQEWLPRMAAGEAIGCFGLTEPDAGADPGSMRTRARRDGDDWVVNGTKMWITNGSVADVAVVWARTDEGVRGFLVPRGTPGFTTQDIHHKLSLRASATSELIFDDVRLPAAAQLPEAAGLRAPLSCLSEARFGIVFGAAGAARACYEAALDYAKTRVQFDKPIAGYQLTQAKLADMAVKVGNSTMLALH